MRIDEPERAMCYGKAVVLCLGNKYRKDDAAGIRVADKLLQMDLGEGVVVESCQSADLSLLSSYGGADRVIIVDALRSDATPGTVSRYDMTPARSRVRSLPGSHSIRLHDMFDIAHQSGLLSCPVTIFGIEPKDTGLGEGISPEVEGVIPRVLTMVIRELNLEPGPPPSKPKVPKRA